MLFAAETSIIRGSLLSAEIAGAEAEVAPVGASRPGAPRARGKIYRVRPRKANRGVVSLRLRVAHEPGFIGGAAFTEPMRLKCGKGRIALGNWALAAEGLRFYSGGAVYEKSFTLAKGQASAGAVLDLGGVGACCGVSVNGGEEKVLVSHECGERSVRPSRAGQDQMGGHGPFIQA